MRAANFLSEAGRWNLSEAPDKLNGEREQDKKNDGTDASQRRFHEYTHKQVWGEGIIKRFSFGRN